MIILLGPKRNTHMLLSLTLSNKSSNTSPVPPRGETPFSDYCEPDKLNELLTSWLTTLTYPDEDFQILLRNSSKRNTAITLSTHLLGSFAMTYQRQRERLKVLKDARKRNNLATAARSTLKNIWNGSPITAFINKFYERESRKSKKMTNLFRALSTTTLKPISHRKRLRNSAPDDTTIYFGRWEMIITPSTNGITTMTRLSRRPSNGSSPRKAIAWRS